MAGIQLELFLPPFFLFLLSDIGVDPTLVSPAAKSIGHRPRVTGCSGVVGGNPLDKPTTMTFLHDDVVVNKFIWVLVELRRDHFAYVSNGLDSFILFLHRLLPIVPRE